MPAVFNNKTPHKDTALNFATLNSCFNRSDSETSVEQMRQNNPTHLKHSGYRFYQTVSNFTRTISTPPSTVGTFYICIKMLVSVLLDPLCNLCLAGNGAVNQLLFVLHNRCAAFRLKKNHLQRVEISNYCRSSTTEYHRLLQSLWLFVCMYNALFFLHNRYAEGRF